ncbi:unnamed protein product [Lactuca saligna]|uniref:Ubiquitin-like protease family profile domain-containing protein n=1 Tax=Lactuca saligna TaxID=75948 RepID=A0AA36EDM9_LACSI|nr:unnamed protein product [Lactuca saligna]
MMNFETLDLKEESDVPEPAVRIMSKVENLNDTVDQCTFMETKQFPEPDLEKIEDEAMPDSVDAISVIQEPPVCHSGSEINLSGPDVNAVPEAEILVCTASALPSNCNLNSSEPDEAANVDPHEHGSLYQRSLSTSCGIAEDDGVFFGSPSDHCTHELEMDTEDLTVIFYPDHMVYGDSYCTDCVLTFTSSCIKIEGSGSTLDGDDKIFKLQWDVQDLVHIKSHWYELVEMAMVTIHVLTEDTLQPENVECTSGTELKFAIMGTNWFGKQEAITTLNVAYKTLWSSMLELEDTVLGQIKAPFTKYFPNFDQPFEEVIYPKGDVDAVSISKRDVDLLLPDTFVNDTIIDFYVKYLKNKIRPEERQRFHFFNSFFFRKLADPEKEPLDALEGKTAFQRVRKWTRKVNLFEKDFVFIPVNYNYHWSLIVMCHLGEVATYKDEEDVTEWTKVPCVLHMDPIRGSHTGLKGLMQSYLKEEWKGRQQEASEDISSRFDNLRFISLELPQQPNSFDCGLFLLHYVELFLEQAPINFNPFKITKSVHFLNTDWFPPADASLKRVVIQRLVYDLLQQPYDEAEAPSSMAANNATTAVNFFGEMQRHHNSPSRNGQTSGAADADDGIEISLLPSLSITSDVEVDPTISLKPGFDQGSFLGMRFPSFNETTFDGYKNSLVPPIQEDVETSVGEFVYAPIGIGIGQENGITPEVTGLQYSSQDIEHQNKFETSPETSISGCEDSLEIMNGRSNGNGNDEQLNFKEIRDEQRLPLMDPVEMLDGNCDADADVGGLTFSLHHRSEMETETETEMETNGCIGSGESSGMESDEQHPAKRIRTTESFVEGGSACN